MPRHRLAPLAPLALSLAIAQAAQAASLTPPNLVTASSLASPDLLLVWPYASGGPLEAMSWATFTAQMQAAIGAAYLKPANNLSDLGNPTVARTNLGLGTAATVNTGSSGATLPFLNGANTWGGVQSFSDSTLVLKGSTSGSLLIRCAPVCGSGSLILPAGSTNFSSTGGTSQVVKQTSAGGALTVGQLQCSDLSDGGNGGCAAAATSGSWTPSLNPATVGNWSFSYTQQQGYYVQVGNSCTVWFKIAGTPTFTTASGILQITSLPVSSNTVYQAAASGTMGANYSGFKSITTAVWYSTPGSGVIQISFGTNAVSIATVANITTGTALNLSGTLNYAC